MAGVHRAEWIIRALIVSGQRLGYSLALGAARCAACAVAALVCRVTVKSRASCVGRLVVRSWKAYGVSVLVPAGDRATLPPSKRTSGFGGQARRSNATDVRLHGDSSP